MNSTAKTSKQDTHHHGPKAETAMGFFARIQNIPDAIDSLWRRLDFYVNRNYGGPGPSWWMNGYATIAVLLPIWAYFFLIAGPTASPGGGPGLTAFASAILVLLLAWSYLAARPIRRPGTSNQVVFVVAGVSMFLITAVWVSFAGVKVHENRPYRHSFLVLGFLLYVLLLLTAWRRARRLFPANDPDNENWRSALEAMHWFEREEPGKISWRTLVYAVFNAPLRYPLLLIYVPSLAVVFTPPAYRDWLWAIAWVTLFLTWLLLLFPSFDDRIGDAVELIRRCLFVGGQMLISLAIIVLAAGRLTDYGYIATVVEGARRTILHYVSCSYVIFWLYEYWLNRVLSDQLLSRFRVGCAASERPGRVTFQGRTVKEEQATRSLCLQVHGAARFVVVDDVTTKPTFATYERDTLFNALAEVNPILRGPAREIKAHIKYYLSSMNILLVMFASGLAWGLSQDLQSPQVTVTAAAPKANVDLRALIFDDAGQPNPRDHVILLAASGEGTRAALYTASVLHGLAALDELDNLVLVSGVSGGGAALAYFAAHQAELQ